MSPRSGAEVPTLGPGQTANPKGSSMKARARAAFKRAMTEAAMDGSLAGLVAVASDPAQGGALVAANKLIWDRLLGPVGGQSQGTVTVRTELVMMPPTGGDDPDDETQAPMLASVVTMNQPVMIESDDEPDD